MSLFPQPKRQVKQDADLEARAAFVTSHHPLPWRISPTGQVIDARLAEVDQQKLLVDVFNHFGGELNG